MINNYKRGNTFRKKSKAGSIMFYYPPEVRRGEYWRLGVILLQYFPLVKI